MGEETGWGVEEGVPSVLVSFSASCTKEPQSRPLNSKAQAKTHQILKRFKVIALLQLLPYLLDIHFLMEAAFDGGLHAHDVKMAVDAYGPEPYECFEEFGLAIDSM